MENQIFRVVVRRAAKTIHFVLEEYPKIKVEGRTREEAEEALLDRIAETFGDGEPVLDLLEEAPATEFWCFRSNESVTTLNPKDLWVDGVCARCGVGRGARIISVQRQIREVIKGDAAFTYGGPVRSLIFSEKLMDALEKGGLSRSDFAPVMDKSGRMFGEVVSSNARVEWVPVKKHVGVRIGAQRCPKCSFSSFGFVHVLEKDIRRFLAKSSKPDLRRRGACVVGTNEPEPVLSTTVRDVIRKRREFRGFVWGRVGFVTPAELSRN